MALKPLTQDIKFYKAKDMEVGQKLTGHYQSTVRSEKNPGFQPTHYFITKDGEKFGINGTSRLNGIIEKNFEPGVYAELTYAGQKQGKGAMPAHTFEVAIDKEDKHLAESNKENSTEANKVSPGSTSAPEMTADDIPL